MAPAQVVALYQSARLTVAAGDGYAPRSFTFPRPGSKGSVEQQLDACLRDLAAELRHFEAVLRTVTTHGVLAGVFEVRRAGFADSRRKLAESYVRVAHRARSLRGAQRMQARATLLDGRPRTEGELPDRLRPRRTVRAPGQYVRSLPDLNRRASTEGVCVGCRLRIPRLRAYQDGRPVFVGQLHRGWPKGFGRRPLPAGPAPLCRSIARDWVLLDPRMLQPLGSPPPLEVPAAMDRQAWMLHHLEQVPVSLGGPLVDQYSVLEEAYHWQFGVPP